MAVTEDDLRRYYHTVDDMVLRLSTLFRYARDNDSVRFARHWCVPSHPPSHGDDAVEVCLTVDETMRIAEETEIYRLSASAAHSSCVFCGYEGACWSNAVILSACVDLPSTILSAISPEQGKPKGKQNAGNREVKRLADVAPLMAQPNGGVYQAFVKMWAEPFAASLATAASRARMVERFARVREAVLTRFSAITSEGDTARFALIREHARVLLEMRRDGAVAVEGEPVRHLKQSAGVMLTQPEIAAMQELCKQDNRATKDKIRDKLAVGSAKAQALMAHARFKGWLNTKPRRRNGKTSI
jgi:hypothetical protein